MQIPLLPLLSILVSLLFPALSHAVTLQSQDGQEVKVKTEVAKKSLTLKNLIEDLGVDHPIPLPNIAGKTLARIVEFMNYDTEHPFASDRGLLSHLETHWDERHLLLAELLEAIKALNYLDIRSRHEGDVLNASLKVYGERVFGHVQLEKVARLNMAYYGEYVENSLSLPADLRRIVLRQSFQSIDRVFLDSTPDRRIHAIKELPLEVAQVVTYIAKKEIPSASSTELPAVMRAALRRWQADFASKIHFGPWPTEFATWPAHCDLPNDHSYNMYSDATPDDRYFDNGDGTITDVCTKLTWEQTPSTREAPWRQSLNNCAQMTKANFTDWRAPTRIELQSIVNYERGRAYTLNRVFHEGTGQASLIYWSSTSAIGYDSEAWTVFFENGGNVLSYDMARDERVRCVRGEKGGRQSEGAKPHYSCPYGEHSETVTDNFTGAVWQRRSPEKGSFYKDAEAYCRDLVLDGSGWLLPTVKALSTLVDIGIAAPRIDRTAFPGLPEKGLWFWSRTPQTPGIYTWGVGFDNGAVGGLVLSGQDKVRCVR